MKKAEKTLRL